MVRTKRRRTQTSTKRVAKTVARLESGTRITPSPDPPEFALTPWWPMTLVSKISQDTTFTFASLADGLLVALAMTSAQQTALGKDFFLIRPQTIRVWGLNRQPISLQPYEIVGNGSHTLRAFADYGSGINYSRLGWRFGSASRLDPNANEDTKIAYVGGTIDATNQVLVYIQVLFCGKGTPEPKESLTKDFGNMVL